MKRLVFVLGLLALVSACGAGPTTQASESPPAPPAPSASSGTSSGGSEGVTMPDYLLRLEKDGDLYARRGDSIVSAPEADIAVLRRYPRWPDKGALSGSGERLTILADKTTYSAGEEVRIIHVHEATKPGVQLYVMGPKAIYGEYVDGVLASPAAAALETSYDGAVIPSPGADHNYEVSVHRFKPGRHTIEWRFATLSGPAILSSNILSVEVR